MKGRYPMAELQTVYPCALISQSDLGAGVLLGVVGEEGLWMLLAEE
jgi:hypothetical protein